MSNSRERGVQDHLGPLDTEEEEANHRNAELKGISKDHLIQFFANSS